MQPLDFKPKAFLFDLNGTMIDDMPYHSKAWHHIINNHLGKELSFDEVNKEMYGKNAELLVRVFGEDHFSEGEMYRISMEKEKRYQADYSPYLSLIEGLDVFLEKGKKAGIKMAIGSAAIPFNIDFVLDGLGIRSYFNAIVSADDVLISKPNAETFLKGAEALGINPKDCIVFEDVPKGVEAAKAAGMKAIVITTTHERVDFEKFDNILGFIADYNDPILNSLL